MGMARKIVTAFIIGLVAGAVSSHASAASKQTDATARSDVRHLLSLMDRDKNGTVSKEEFLQYMSETFDSLDVNRSGQLEPTELNNVRTPIRKHPGGR
jgi:Ca2+-binding EF-hand superfamily protein